MDLFIKGKLNVNKMDIVSINMSHFLPEKFVIIHPTDSRKTRNLDQFVFCIIKYNHVS